MVYGLRFIVYGFRFMVYGLPAAGRFIVCGLVAAAGLWFAASSSQVDGLSNPEKILD
jgi:hypothetical protein